VLDLARLVCLSVWTGGRGEAKQVSLSIKKEAFQGKKQCVCVALHAMQPACASRNYGEGILLSKISGNASIVLYIPFSILDFLCSALATQHTSEPHRFGVKDFMESANKIAPRERKVWPLFPLSCVGTLALPKRLGNFCFFIPKSRNSG